VFWIVGRVLGVVGCWRMEFFDRGGLPGRVGVVFWVNETWIIGNRIFLAVGKSRMSLFFGRRRIEPHVHLVFSHGHGMVGIRGEPELPGLFGTDMVFAHDICHRVQAATTAPLSLGRENMRASVTPFGLGVNGFDFHQKRLPRKGSRARDELGPFVKAGGRHPKCRAH